MCLKISVELISLFISLFTLLIFCEDEVERFMNSEESLDSTNDDVIKVLAKALELNLFRGIEVG